MDNSGRCFITEALSAIFMPKIEYRTSLLRNEERFFISDELCQGGLSMPNPKAIDVPRFGFTEVETIILHTMMNFEDTDYSTVDEMSKLDVLSEYPFEIVRKAMENLNNRSFLLEVKKPYGIVYAVNKLRIPNMMFDYS